MEDSLRGPSISHCVFALQAVLLVQLLSAASPAQAQFRSLLVFPPPVAFLWAAAAL